MNSGAYQLLIYNSEGIEIQVGALGEGKFQTGYYIYTGSAMKNLAQRVNRHLSKNKKIRWHIDYLLMNENIRVIGYKFFPSRFKIECELNSELINNPKSLIPMKGFGSSDCNNCESHFVYLGKKIPHWFMKDGYEKNEQLLLK